MSWIQLESSRGEPVQAGDATLTPESQALRVQWPGGGFVYNRPAAVTVERGGLSERLRVLDTTRLAQIAFLLAAGIFVLIGLSIRPRRSK
jgi:hypothetical protein